VSSACQGPAHSAVNIIARLIAALFYSAEMTAIASVLVHVHGYIWPAHLRFIVNPYGTPRFLRSRRRNFADDTGTRSILRTICDLVLSLAEIPIIMCIFAAGVGAYCLAGFLVWYFIPALRPTRLAYTAVCMGVECVKYVWPFVSAVLKEAAKEITVISASEGPTLQQVMEREGRSTLYPSSYPTDIVLVCVQASDSSEQSANSSWSSSSPAHVSTRSLPILSLLTPTRSGPL
jgi:hypothetical protein